MEDITSRADVLIDTQSLGLPGTNMGDINGDGFSDLVFVKAGNPSLVNVVYGRPSWPRILNLTSSGALTVAVSGLAVESQVQTAVLNWDGDRFQDLYVAGRVSGGFIIPGKAFPATGSVAVRSAAVTFPLISGAFNFDQWRWIG